ncbi:T9SS type A sorting domain-containing protein [Flavobacterium sp.]|uniref:T9SS type A sorting domain-containing protein n=1 Tax=Flavobacterium sp. TaxID=239 RepID=UPI003526E964
MKKLYFLTLLATAFTFGQSVVITTVIDGTLPSDGCAGSSGSSNPKLVELYVSGTVDLTNYRLQTESNGAADAASISWNTGCDLTALGTVTDSFIYLVGAGETTFTEMYPSATPAAGLTSLPNGNGNDAYRVALYDAPGTAGNLVSVMDQFGDPLDLPVNDYSAAWCYQDSYAKRNNGVVANGGTFDSSTFTYGGNAAFASPNNTCAFITAAVPVGTFTLTTKAFNGINGLTLYPNPVSGNVLNITSSNNGAMSVQIFDVLGKRVANTSVINNQINISGLNSGVYIVKITEEGKTATRKLVVK